MINQSIEIVIPAYNEEKNIEIVIKKSLNWLKHNTKNYLVSVVNDGSSDNTGKILDSLAKTNKHLRVLHHKRNLGIGEAWRTLYKESSKDLILSCPADQQFDPKDFSCILPYVNKADIISIYRYKKEDYTLFRQFLTHSNKILIKLLFNLNIKDINWVKMFRKWTLKDLDLQLRSSLVEIEILAKAKKRKAKIIQVGSPSHVRGYGKSKGAGIKNLYRVFLELLKLYPITIKFK